MIDIALGFRNADGEMLNELVHCLDFMNGLPFFKAYKAHSWEKVENKKWAKTFGCCVRDRIRCDRDGETLSEREFFGRRQQ